MDEIKAKLLSKECYVRPRASGSSSDVWSLFQEVAYSATNVFTGIVECKSCGFLARYHGQITGTSHMRRHSCFSFMFPNSVPATKKNKSTLNSPKMGNINADSTTPKTLKRIKKEIDLLPNASNPNGHDNTSTMLHVDGVRVDSPRSSVTIHPVMPKKKLRVSAYADHQDRSLIVGHSVSNSLVNKPGPQSILQQMHADHSNGHSPHSDISHPASSSSSPHSSPPLNLSLTPTANIQHIKDTLCNNAIAFCVQERIPVKSVMSDVFNDILKTHLKLCTSVFVKQMHHQQSQTVSSTTMMTSALNRLWQQALTSDKLYAHFANLVASTRESITKDISDKMDLKVGGALVCDYRNGACVISIRYVDYDWKLVELVLSASAMVNDVNMFLGQTLATYALQDKETLSKFAFVSQGGVLEIMSTRFDSAVHCLDKVINDVLCNPELSSANNINAFFDKCISIAMKYQIVIALSHDGWRSKYEMLMEINKNESTIKHELDMAAVRELIELFEFFVEASRELKKSVNYPTLCFVLLYYYQLKSQLACDSVNPTSEVAIEQLKSDLMASLERGYNLTPMHRVATFLWPNFRLLKMLDTDEREKVHENVRSLLKTRFAENMSACQSLSPDGHGDTDADLNGKCLKKSRSKFDEWEVMLDQDQDEVDKYLTGQLTSCAETNILQWWREHAVEFPKLSKLAKWLLTVPASVTSQDRFQVDKNRLVDDEMWFLHCNL